MISLEALAVGVGVSALAMDYFPATFIGSVAVLYMVSVLPNAISFATGTMMFVIAEELILGTKTKGIQIIATLGLMGIFVFVMILDVVLV